MPNVEHGPGPRPRVWIGAGCRSGHLGKANVNKNHMPAIRRSASIVVLMLSLGLGAQFYTAGLGLIAGYGMNYHAILGWVLVLLSIVALVLVSLSKPGRAITLVMVGVTLLMVLQPVLILAVRKHAPALAALHAVNGVIALALMIAALRSNALGIKG